MLACRVGKAAFHLRPVFNQLAAHLKRSPELFMDETRAPVLNPGRSSSAERRLAERQARSAPLVEAFGEWLKQQRARVSPKSRLIDKLAYIARHRVGLQLFPADGRVEMDSNNVENLIRPVTLNRKNACSRVTTKAPQRGAGSLRRSSRRI